MKNRATDTGLIILERKNKINVYTQQEYKRYLSVKEKINMIKLSLIIGISITSLLVIFAIIFKTITL